MSWEEPAVGGQALRVKRYNGNDSAPVWTLMDGGSLNSGAGVFPSYPKLLSTDAGLFLAWHEGTPHQVRVRRFNGDTANPAWPFVDGGAANIAFSSLEEAEFPHGTSLNGRLYVAWSETTSTVRQIHVKAFDGNESSPGWTFLDGGDGTGINRTTATGLAPHLVSTPTGVYATWVEYYIAVPQVRVARGT